MMMMMMIVGSAAAADDDEDYDDRIGGGRWRGDDGRNKKYPGEGIFLPPQSFSRFLGCSVPRMRLRLGLRP